MNMVDFVKQEEAGDFITGVIDQLSYDVSEETRENALRDVIKISKMYEKLEEEHDRGTAGAYIMTVITIYLTLLYDNDIKIEINPKGY